VFTSKDATTDLNVNFLSLKVDVDKSKGADIAAIYEVEALPTLLFLNANGEVLERRIGAVGVEDFKKLTRAAMAKGGKS
jgi:thioredoxin-related protein